MFVSDSKGLYRCEELDEFVWQKHAFGSRLSNPPALTLRQVHSATVVIADGLADREREGDALVASRAGLAVGVRTADCVPILLLDSRTRAVAAAHAGWRGTAGEIMRQTLLQMGGRPEDKWAAIGPSIRSCCYQVGWDVGERFTRWLPGLAPDDAGKIFLALAEANAAQLVEAGVPAAQIFDSGICTACRFDRFFSYRREPGNPGRMVAAICRLA